jgi:Rieske 2Fe-2S family protein
MMNRGEIRRLLDSSRPAHTLAREFYAAPELFDFDVDEVLTRSWLIAGFEVELPESGSYLAMTVGKTPVLLARGRDGQIRGFYNTCRHRGSRLCDDGIGRTGRLVCPYHKWTYDLEGKLLAAPRMGNSFETGLYGLRRIRVELVAGCIYIALSDEAPDFAPFQKALEPLLAPYRLSNAKVAFESTLLEKANWKLVMENARECLHCAASHPELKHSFPTTIQSGFAFGETEHNLRYRERLESLDLPTTAVEDTWWHAGRYPLNPGIDTISMDGRPIVARPLIDVPEGALGGFRWATEANNFCHVLRDYAFVFSAMPTGPMETIVTSKWLVHKDAVENIDYTIEALTTVWTQTNLQDRALAENNQRGVNGVGYVSGPYSSEAEDFVIRFSNWYRASVEAALKS